MKFGNPPMFVLLLITVSLLSLFLAWAWRKRQRDMAQFVKSRLLANLTVGVHPLRQKIRLVLAALAVASVFAALARPQWGFSLEELKQSGLDIVVALDASRSMLAQDVAPNRLQRAKLAALELMPLAKTDRLGLVAFAGTAFLQCPLTVDDEAFRQSVNLIDVDIIPQGGTAIAEAIRTALTAFKNDEDHEKALILFTDGEDHEQGVMEAAEAAAKAGARIYTIGVGTAQGELLPSKIEKNGSGFIKDEEGNVVKSRLNEALLQQVAKATGGFYLPLRGANTMDVLYERGLAPLLGQVKVASLKRSEKRPPRIVKHFQDRFQWPLTLAVALLIVEIFVPVRRWVRRPKTARPRAAATPVQAAVAIVLLALNPNIVKASANQARQLYDSGKYQAAQKDYQRLREKNPKDPRLAFNAGASAYQDKNFQTAVTEFDQAATAPDLKLQQGSFYNLGNAYYRLGEAAAAPQEKMDAWQQALKNYEAALKLNSKDPDADFNRGFVEKMLEELKKQMEQQQRQDQQQPPKDKQDQQKKDDQSQKDQKDQKQDQQKPDNQSQDQKEKDPQQEKNQDSGKDQQNQKTEGQDPPKESPGPKEKQQKPASSPQDKSGQTNQTDQAESQAGYGKMTPQQVQQLLDAQKQEEKAMKFMVPQKPRPRSFKDW